MLWPGLLALIREDPLVDEDQERMNKRLEKLEVRGKGTLGDKSHLRKSVVIERHSNSAYGESRPALSCWSVAFWAQLLSGGAGVVDANDDGWDEPTMPIRPCVLPALSAWLALLLVGFCSGRFLSCGRFLSRSDFVSALLPIDVEEKA